MSNVKMVFIDYNPKSGNFVLTAPIWANDLIRAIPNRRFQSRTKSWTAPATRINVTYMAQNLGGASWTRVALMKLAEVKSSVGKAIAPALPFPLHYQFKTKPFKTQKIALEKAFGRDSFAFYKDMGCITGDAVVQVNRLGKSRKMTLAQLYAAYNKTPDGNWRIRSLVDGEFRQHKMITIINKGEAEIVELTLVDGKKLRMTPDHPVMNPAGEWVQPKDLKPGDKILTNGMKKVCFVPKELEVVSVLPAGREVVYDVAMEAPHHNFVANGIIVHNTGKTKTFIDLAGASRIHPLIESVLLVCPIGVRKNWLRELEIHSSLPFDAYLLNTAKPKEFKAWLDKPHDFKWLVIGVESLGISKNAYEMMLEYIIRYPRTMFCIDESHKVKNHAALRSQRCHAAARHCPYRVAMTGTPIAKGVMDLYSQFEFLNPDILGVGDFYSFRGRYAEMGGHDNKEIIGYQNLDELMEIVSPFVYQVRKEEALPDLPPKMRTKRYVTLTPDQVKHYKSMVKDKIVISDDNRSLTVKNSLGKALRLQQICGGFVPFETDDPFQDRKVVVTEPTKGANPKIDDLLEFCDEIDGSIIVWCAFRPEIDAVVAALRAKYGDDDVVEVHGGISEEQRDINVNELFQKKVATKLVANVQTGGTGLTMTAAEYEYFFSNTHNSIDREQGEDRAHRKGQLKSVLIVDCVAQIEVGGACVDTIDAAITTSLEAKKDLSEYIRGEIDRLAADGIRDLSSIFGL